MGARALLFAFACVALFVSSGQIDHDEPVSTNGFAPARMPLRFEANAGQWEPRIGFVARAGGAVLAIERDATRIMVANRTLTMKLHGARESVPAGEHELSGKTNYFIGDDPSRWRTNVPTFASVRVKDSLPGVDVIWHEGGAGGLEYDLVVAAGADASRIAIDIEGADAMRIADDGSLEISTQSGRVVQRPPRVFQHGKELRTHHVLVGASSVGFDIEGYDRASELLIDPNIGYVTNFGSDDVKAMAADASGNVYFAGTATAIPTTSNAYDPTAPGGTCAYVTKLDASGTALVYSTYLGAPAYSTVAGIALDSSGDAYVTGTAGSGIPTTSGAYQTTAGGSYDVFVMKLDASGSSLLYSTYLGGTGVDFAGAIALDSSGDVYVTGGSSGAFPTTAGAFDTTYHSNNDYNVFVSKLDSSGASLLYSTYLHGNAREFGNGIAVDSSGSAYVVGYTASATFPTTTGAYQTTYGGALDAFVAKLDSSGSALDYSTFLGGSGDDDAGGVVVDSSGHAYVAGETHSSTFPTTSGVYQTTYGGVADAFVTKLDPSGASLAFSTFVGGSFADGAAAIARDASGNIYVAGNTAGTFPTTSDAYQKNYAGGASDGIFVELDPTASTLLYASDLGDSGTQYATALALDPLGDVYVGGMTNGYLSTLNAFWTTSGDAFIAKFSLLSLSPWATFADVGDTVAFTASGGSGGYTFSIVKNASGATINASTGFYTAGTEPGVTDVIEVTDSAGRVTTGAVMLHQMMVYYVPPVYPHSTTQMVAIGGSGTYTWAITVNASGGSINASTGVYTAGATGMVDDKVVATDSFGNTAAAIVNVGPGVFISPASATTAPHGFILFSAGGGNHDYTFSISTNNSGGSINATTGAYSAGSLGSCTDTITVSDSIGNSASALVTVGAVVSILPPSASVPPKGSASFTASGGSGTGYTWALATNASGGTITSTGAYQAGAKGNVSDVITVTDSYANVASATVTVGASLSITPATPAVPPKGSLAFSASGGSGTGFTWSIPFGPSGGSVDASTGVYTAGAVGNVADEVRVTDSLGNTADVNVSVGGGLAVNPASPSTPPRGSLAFQIVGGSGGGYVWWLSTNASSASIDSATGAYTAGTVGGVTDVVEVIDSISNKATVQISVTASLAIAPQATNVMPGQTVLLSGSGGSGAGYAWSLEKNASGGQVGTIGNYTAGASAGTDVVRLVDSLGNVASATLIVGQPAAGPSAQGGCSCDAAGAATSGSSWWLLLGALFVRRRRR